MIKANGNIGIGTVNPADKSSINGRIEFTEAQVKAIIVDYVFKDNYDLISFEDFIEKNKQLSNVFSEMTELITI